MKKVLDKIFGVKINPIEFSDDSIRSIILNHFHFITIITLAYYFILYCSINQVELALTLTPVLAGIGYTYYLNELGKTKKAKFLFIIFLNTSVLLFSFLLSKEAGAYLLYFPIICVTSILYPLKESKKIILLTSYSVICLVLIVLSSPFHKLQFPLDPTNHQIIYMATFLISIFDIFFCLYYFTKINNEYEAKLTKAKESAENATNAKTTFLSNLSHEIRNPMNAIIGLTDMLLDEKLESKTNDYIKTIKFSAENLLVIINDILDFSKIEAGMMTIQNVNFNLRDLLNEHLKIINPRANQKGLKINLKINKDIPAYLIGDPIRINQVLLNLTGNAIKFTEQGIIGLSVDLKEENEDSVKLRFWVRDTGIGISHNNLKVVFERFAQVGKYGSAKKEGTGLGLAICKKLVELQGGQIGVASKPEIGSSFYFDLTFPIGKSEDNMAVAEMLCFEKFSGKRVLLAEDNLINQLVAEQMLLKWDIAIDKVSSNEEAVQKLKEYVYDIVLLDLQLEDSTGFDTISMIRNGLAGEHHINVPVIAVSADGYEETRQMAIRSGMNDFLFKPFHKEELYNKLYKYLKPAKKVQSEELNTNTATVTSSGLLNMNKIKSQIGNDPNIIKEYLTIFASSTKEDIINLEEALSSKNYVYAQRLAHKLKSSFKNSGVTETAEKLYKIEKLPINSFISDEVTVKNLLHEVKISYQEVKTEIDSINSSLYLYP